jgi:hypothetical protein
VVASSTMQTTKHVIDGFSVGMLVAWITGILGPLATLVTIFWLGMQITINWGKFKDAICGIREKRRRKDD